jgi:hypothetical protein
VHERGHAKREEKEKNKKTGSSVKDTMRRKLMKKLVDLCTASRQQARQG